MAEPEAKLNEFRWKTIKMVSDYPHETPGVEKGPRSGIHCQSRVRFMAGASFQGYLGGAPSGPGESATANRLAVALWHCAGTGWDTMGLGWRAGVCSRPDRRN